MFFALIFLLGFVSASSVTSTIVDGEVLVEIELSDGASVVFPEKYFLLENNSELISFTSKKFLRNDGDWILVLPRVVDSDYDLRVYLPRNHVLVDDLVYPKDYVISSDGVNIILSWDDFSESEVIVFYEGVESSNFFFWVIIVGLIIIGILVFVFKRKKFFKEVERLKMDVRVKNRISKKIMISQNLFGDEKKIVEFLSKKKRRSCWTKELVKELGISKVRLSRKIRSLVEKGLIEREKFGKENRIILVKK